MALQPMPREIGVPVSYHTGFTVLSIFTSLAGCATTLELLHRRTSTKGIFNWFLLIGACIAMGGSGIWSMHFIANRAVTLLDGEPERQIMYSPGFTALSVFLPVLVLLAAFYFLGANRSKSHPIYLILAGILTGTAVCGMHYVGNAGIRNYHCHYSPANVAGAAVIAIIASLVALGIFFHLRETWTDSWWKRALCALILAGAVCGMHWTAAVGTKYIPNEASQKGTTSVQTVIVCAVLSFSCCFVLLVIASIRGAKIRLSKTRAQQVVLACAYFDETGRIMVTQEGAFPCHKITNRYIEKDFGEDELSRSHPTFLWVFRASRNWLSVRDLVPSMARNLDSDPSARKYRPGHQSPLSDASSEVSVNFSNVFKQLFCVAASQLSQSLHEPLENIGLLFEEALDTGTIHLIKSKTNETVTNGADPEAEPFNFGRGKYLFLNRQLTKAHADRFASMGYRFASVPQVSELLAKNMDVKVARMVTRLERMKTSVSSAHLPPPGVHLGCFMVKPSIYKSFDVLVPTMTQNQLPMASLKLFLLTSWHQEIIRQYDEWQVKDLIDAIQRLPSSTSEAERDFYFTLHAALMDLIDQVGDMSLMLNAVFSARPVHIPCQGDDSMSRVESDKCTLLTIRSMNNIHGKPAAGMAYVPLSFFGAQQVVEAGDPRERERWDRRVRMEFGTVSERSASHLDAPPSSPWGAWSRDSRSRSSRASLSRIWPPWLYRERAGSGNRGKGESEEETRIVKTVEISLKEEKDDDGTITPDINRVTSNGESMSANNSIGDADDFEKRELSNRGRYVAGVSAGLPSDRADRLSNAGLGVEMVEIEAAEKGDGGWVSEVFGMFRL